MFDTQIILKCQMLLPSLFIIFIHNSAQIHKCSFCLVPVCSIISLFCSWRPWRQRHNSVWQPNSLRLWVQDHKERDPISRGSQSDQRAPQRDVIHGVSCRRLLQERELQSEARSASPTESITSISAAINLLLMSVKGTNHLCCFCSFCGSADWFYWSETSCPDVSVCLVRSGPEVELSGSCFDGRSDLWLSSLLPWGSEREEKFRSQTFWPVTIYPAVRHRDKRTWRSKYFTEETCFSHVEHGDDRFPLKGFSFSAAVSAGQSWITKGF